MSPPARRRWRISFEILLTDSAAHELLEVPERHERGRLPKDVAWLARAADLTTFSFECLDAPRCRTCGAIVGADHASAYCGACDPEEGRREPKTF